MLLCLFIAALWSSAGTGLTSLLLIVIFIVVLLLSHVVSCVSVSIPDLCHLSYFAPRENSDQSMQSDKSLCCPQEECLGP